MPRNEDIQWRSDLMKLVGEIKTDQREIKTDQKNLSNKVDDYHKTSCKRCDRLEATVYGIDGDKPGLVEQVRGISGKMAAGVALVTFLVTSVTNGILYYFVEK